MQPKRTYRNRKGKCRRAFISFVSWIINSNDRVISEHSHWLLHFRCDWCTISRQLNVKSFGSIEEYKWISLYMIMFRNIAVAFLMAISHRLDVQRPIGKSMAFSNWLDFCNLSLCSLSSLNKCCVVSSKEIKSNNCKNWANQTGDNKSGGR